MGTPIARGAVVEWARDIYDDLDFTVVRQWLEEHPKGKGGGYLPVYAPREVLHATGFLPVGIHGGGDRLEIIRGDAFYQSYICHLPRSVIELAQSGRLDMLSAVLFPSTCDVIRNLSGIWKLLYPDVYVRYVDVPQIPDPGAAAEFWADELRRLLDDLGDVTGHRPTDEELRRSIALYNETREMIRTLYALRRERPWDVPTEELYVLLRAGESIPPEEFLAHARCADRRRSGARARRGVHPQRHAYVGALRDRPARQAAADEGPRRRRKRRRDHLRHAKLLRSRIARPADAALRRREGRHSVHRVQVCGEHRSVSAIPRAGGDVRRFHQIVGGRLMTEALKDRSMVLQKEMIANHFARLARAPETGEPVVYTFVPGNLTELIRSFDALPVLPEINALQSGMRKLSGEYIAEAERAGHAEDVCTYVKCDIGMMRSGNIGPGGKKLPKPDLLLLSYTGCYTFMKWFELLREEYDCPTVMFHVPYQGDGKLEPEHREYMLRQLREQVIPALEKATGRKYDEEKLRHHLALSAMAEEDLVAVLQAGEKHTAVR